MPARRRLWHPDIVRRRIQASQLVNRLQAHALGQAEMTVTQIKAAEILLRKVIPDLRTTEHTGNVQHRHLTQYTDAELLAFIEKAHRRDLGGGVAAEAGSALVPVGLHAVHDPELEGGEGPQTH